MSLNLSVSVAKTTKSDLDLDSNLVGSHSYLSSFSSDGSSSSNSSSVSTTSTTMAALLTPTESEGQNQHLQLTQQGASQLKTSLRIRVINESSKRSKDLVVDVSSKTSLYDAVYNKQAVKDQHVRKWPADIVQQVKDKTSVIRMAVWDDQLDKPTHLYHVQELHQTTAQHLLELVGPETNLIKLVLQCCPATGDETYDDGDDDGMEVNAVGDDLISPSPADTNIAVTSKQQPEGAVAFLLDDVNPSSAGDKKKPAAKSAGPTPPSACPFSGVAVDPAMWESFQAKLANNDNHQHHHNPQTPAASASGGGATNNNSSSTPKPGAPSSSSHTDAQSTKKNDEELSVLQQQLDNSAQSHHQSTFRVRVINQTTKRAKDLLVEVNEDDTLFDRVYNHASVKEAHVRNWGSDIARDVRRGKADIVVNLLWGDADWNGVAARKNLTPEELQSMTTQDLYNMVPEEDRVNLLVSFHLVCVKQQQPTNSNKEKGAIGDQEITERQATKKSPPVVSSSPGCQKKLGSPPMNKQQQYAQSPPVKKCNTHSHLESRRVYTKSKSQSALQRRHSMSTPGNAYVASPYRRQGTAESAEGSLKSPFSRQYTGQSYGSAGNRRFRRSNTLNSISSLDSSMRLSKLGTPRESPSLMDLDDSEQGNNNMVISHGTSSGLESASVISHGFFELSMIMDSSQQQSHHLAPANKEKTTLGVRVINRVTERFKDVVVDISDTASVYDTVYNHPGVKEAHVRKYGSEIAKQVKAGEAAITFSVWDDDTEKPWCVFSIDELKQTTTRQLYELASENSQIVKIYLDCCTVESKSNLEHASGPAVLPAVVPTLPPAPQTSLRLENGRPQSCPTPSLQHSRSDPNLLGCEEGIKLTKKPPRMNHMNMPGSPLRSVTFHSSTSDTRRLSQCRSHGALKSLSSASLHSTSSKSSTDRLQHCNSHGALKLLGVKERLKKKNLLSSYSNTDLRGPKSPIRSGLQKRSPSSEDIGAQNATWRSVSTRLATTSLHKVLPRARTFDTTTIGSKSDAEKPTTDNRQQFLKRRVSDSSMNGTTAKNNKEKSDKMLRELMRLLRSKTNDESQMRRSLQPTISRSDHDIDSSLNDYSFSESHNTSFQESFHMSFHEGSNLAFHGSHASSIHVSVPAIVQAQQERRGSMASKMSALSFQERKPGKHMATGRRNTPASPMIKAPGSKLRGMRNQQPTPPRVNNAKTNDKILRFLTPQKPASAKSVVSASNSYGSAKMDHPPIKEISVIANGGGASPTLFGVSAPISTPTGVSLPPSVVKEVFPYHIVLDADFRIIQVGNSFNMLIQDASVIGRLVSDILMVSSPMPMFGNWSWETLEKMKDKTIFLETVLSPEKEDKVKVKGTVISVSESPKQVMLALFPNVKNLSELEESNLSMADLPLHSCQREAVLLGEHSKSEVKLTNHLDKLHRELIDSMEQQIKDRTEELGEANSGLEKANSQLAVQSARQLEHFACMSHEIRTPLNCIVGMSSLLLDEADDLDPMHSDAIRMINTSGDLLRAVVDDVLDYAKLESGSFEVDIKETNLQHTLDSVVHSISQKFIEKGCRLRTYYAAFLPEKMEVDYRRLQQILFNLLGNAGKFSKINSAVDLTVSVVPVSLTKIEPSDTCDNNVIRFSVKDYGKGIEEKDFETIFQPFSQASKETQNVYGGTGLGLSITSKLVQRLGGTISLRSEYGKYSEFTVDLPFRGKQVDKTNLRERLTDATIVLVKSEVQFDYGFADSVMQTEPTPFQPIIQKTLNLDIRRFGTMEAAYDELSKQDIAASGKQYAFLVQENLFQLQAFQRLQMLDFRIGGTLTTFGPEYSIDMTKDRHFKSLEGIFPSSLMERIAANMDKRKGDTLFAAKRSDNPARTVGLFAGLPALSNQIAPTGGLFAGLPAVTIQSPQLAQTSAGGLFVNLGKSNPIPEPAHGASQQPKPKVGSTLSKAKQSVVAIPQRDVKVLYAEDNKINQKVLSRVLVRSGISDITIVDNGQKAVDICDTTKFSIIFMDVQMPVMGGMEATKIIVERDPTAKVIFVTAHALDEFKTQADTIGATSFISKPFRLEDIKKVLNDLGF